MTKCLLVQQHCDNAWEHMVSVILLNLTSHIQVREVLPALLRRYPTCEDMAAASLVELESIVTPLGLYRERARHLKDMSKAFLVWDGEDATELPGIGKYGSDSYRIFFKDEIPCDVQDRTLRKHLGLPPQEKRLPVIVARN